MKKCFCSSCKTDAKDEKKHNRNDVLGIHKVNSMIWMWARLKLIWNEKKQNEEEKKIRVFFCEYFV